MTAIASQHLAPGVLPHELWRGVASATHAWLGERRLAVADAVVLLPFADLIAPARHAFAQHAPWMPRVHTARTLAAALGPPVSRAAGELTGDAAIDRVAASELLRGQAWVHEWLRRDPHGFDAALQRVVHTAHTLQRHAASLPPHERVAWWSHARQQAQHGSGPGAMQRSLLRLALEWAAVSILADTDRLFEHRPSAWIVIALGGDDPLAANVSRHAAAQAE